MNGTVVARVRRILAGHSERTLVHAVDQAGLEYKLEVPSDALRDLRPGQEHTLTLSWALQPVVSSKPAAPPAATPTPLPSAVDEEFMALMSRRRGASAVGQIPPAGPIPSPRSEAVTSMVDQIAQKLGIRPTPG